MEMVHRGFYMFALVLLNLLNELRKKDEALDKPTFYLFSSTRLIHAIQCTCNTGARM